jgi:predicted component of type VI protein secretion system
MALFGVDSGEWPRELWFSLACLLAHLPKLASSEEGLRLALGVLFKIPVRSLRFRPSLSVVQREKTTLLGARASRLGVDAIAGDAVEELAHLQIELGPVSLETYENFAAGERHKLLLRAMDYLVPAFLDFEIHWVVEDARRCPQLGVARRNSRLGVNTHLGDAA